MLLHGLVTLLALAGPGGDGARPLQVVSVAPGRHAVDVSCAASVRLTFDRPLDPASLDGSSVRMFGHWTGPVPGQVAVTGAGEVLEFVPLRPYAPGDEVLVQVSSRVAGLDGATLTGGHFSSFRTRTSPAAPSYALAGVLDLRLGGEGLVQVYGAYAGDLDGDGAPDLSLPTELGSDVRVVRNDGCGVFDASPAVFELPNGASPSANDGGDFDGDGALDLATADIGAGTVSVFLGDGAGGYLAPVSYPVGTVPRGVAAFDADGDGDTDLVAANRGSSSLALLRNLGDGSFAAAQTFDGGGNGETAVVVVDADGDGWPDLFVADHLSSELSLLRGDGVGHFVLSDKVAVGNAPWNLVAGDLDGDGAVDAVTANSGSGDVSIVRGDGAGGLLAAVPLDVGNMPIAVDLGDLDGDGDLDLVTSNYGTDDWTVWLNDGAGVFGGRFELPASNAGSCAVLVDDDRDGRLDILGIDELADTVRFFRPVVAGLPGVAQASCEATLRVDNLAHRAGFGGQPPHLMAPGTRHFLGVSAPPGALLGIGIGLPLEPGIPTLGGPFHLGAPRSLPFVGLADGFGEALFRVTVPPGAALGLQLAVQALVETPVAIVMSNPEVVRVDL